jgi:hypothetical protein
VKVKPFNGLSLRGGRMTMPLFAVSDFRNVNYANTWIRPPNEVYSLAMLTHLDGVDATYSFPVGTTTLSASVLGGNSVFIGPPGDEVKVREVRGFNMLWETDWMTVRVGQVKVKVTVTDPWDPYTFSGIGVTYDHSNIVAQVEYATRRSELVPQMVNANGWYVLAGYRFGKAWPYVSHAHTNPTDNTLPFHLTGKQTTTAIGLRWDAFKAAAVKLQYEHVDTHDTWGTSFASLPTSSSSASWLSPVSITRPVNVLSASLDFVF